MHQSNLTPEETHALSNLCNHTDIVSKPAEKGGAVVVWRRDYVQGQRQLSDDTFYEPCPNDATVTHNHLVCTAIKDLIDQKLLPTEALALVLLDCTLGKPSFYLLPKIHKQDSPGRPIVSACSCPTMHISDFLDSIFQPIVQKLPSYVKDINHALQIFSNFPLNQNSLYHLFVMDVCSLYTSIPHTDGLAALKFFLAQHNDPQISTSVLLCLAELVLTLISFEFNGQYFNQISGVVMGMK
jgi:hypothetical protein